MVMIDRKNLNFVKRLGTFGDDCRDRCSRPGARIVAPDVRASLGGKMRCSRDKLKKNRRKTKCLSFCEQSPFRCCHCRRCSVNYVVSSGSPLLCA